MSVDLAMSFSFGRVIRKFSIFGEFPFGVHFISFRNYMFYSQTGIGLACAILTRLLRFNVHFFPLLFTPVVNFDDVNFRRSVRHFVFGNLWISFLASTQHFQPNELFYDCWHSCVCEDNYHLESYSSLQRAKANMHLIIQSLNMLTTKEVGNFN